MNKITTLAEAIVARTSHDPAVQRAADGYFARRNRRVARRVGRPFAASGVTARLARSA